MACALHGVSATTVIPRLNFKQRPHFFDRLPRPAHHHPQLSCFGDMRPPKHRSSHEMLSALCMFLSQLLRQRHTERAQRNMNRALVQGIQHTIFIQNLLERRIVHRHGEDDIRARHSFCRRLRGPRTLMRQRLRASRRPVPHRQVFAALHQVTRNRAAHLAHGKKCSLHGNSPESHPDRLRRPGLMAMDELSPSGPPAGQEAQASRAPVYHPHILPQVIPERKSRWMQTRYLFFALLVAFFASNA